MDRVLEIDLLRFVAALSVVFFHYSFRGWAADNFTSMHYPAVIPVAKYGWLGVHLFFIISGFVISMTAQSGCARRFVISRIVRLYPAYWFCCTLTFLTIVAAGAPYFHASLSRYLVNMTMLNSVIKVEAIDGAYWSLFVELRFYGLVMLLLLFRQAARMEIFLGLWLILCIVTSGFGIRRLPWFIIPEYAPYFVAGAVFYLIWKHGSSPYRGTLVGASFALSAMRVALETADYAVYYKTSFSAAASVTLVAVFFAAFMAISSRLTSRFASPVYIWLGVLTYPLYLLHQFIGFIIFNVTYGRVNVHIIFWGTIALMILLAYCVHTYLESWSAPALKRVLQRLLRVPTTRPPRADNGMAQLVGSRE